MKQMNQMMKQMKKMQDQLMKAQQELEAKEFEGTAGGGVVKVTLNGKKEMLGLDIKPDAVDVDDLEMLQDLIIAAYNEAQKQVDEATSKDLGKLTGGLNIPGLF
jgi:DNA-binding YbaB/EbfC family protein